MAEQICIRLQKHLEDGEYTDITEGEFLAFALTTHMQEVNQDEHLWVRWYAEPLPDHEGPLRQNQEWMDEKLKKPPVSKKLFDYLWDKVEKRLCVHREQIMKLPLRTYKDFKTYENYRKLVRIFK